MLNLFTKKIYYKKFNHRMVINTRSRTAPAKQPTAEIIEWLLVRKFGNSAKPSMPWRGLSTYSYIDGTYNYTVFFKDMEVFDYINDMAGEFIEILEKPMSDEHTEMLESNDKLITRKQLFYGKYRMCLRVSPEQIGKWQTSSKNIDQIKIWCREQFGDDRENADRYMMSGWSKGNFYFADPKDAILFKLTWGNQDVKTERVITHAELENEKTA